MKSTLSEKINLWLMSNQDKLPSEKISILKTELAKIDESKFNGLTMLELKNPTTILLFALFLGGFSLDRFLLGSIGVGIARILTAHGLGIWWLIDTISAQKRTKEYNFSKIKSYLGLM